jgi:hypothetical protein
VLQGLAGRARAQGKFKFGGAAHWWGSQANWPDDFAAKWLCLSGQFAAKLAGVLIPSPDQENDHASPF